MKLGCVWAGIAAGLVIFLALVLVWIFNQPHPARWIVNGALLFVIALLVCYPMNRRVWEA